MMLVIASVAAAFDWPQLGKFLLPISEHMGFDATQFAHLTDGEVALNGYGREGVLHLNH
jgi:hypothetical protein